MGERENCCSMNMNTNQSGCKMEMWKEKERNLRHTESFGDEGWEESNADIYWKFDERAWVEWENEWRMMRSKKK